MCFATRPWCASRGRERQNRSPVWGQRGPAHEIHLAPDSTVLNRSNRFGTHLPGQVHLQRAIDGHKPVESANDLWVVGVGNRVELDRGVIVKKVHQALRPHDKTGDYLAAIEGFAGAGNDSSLDEVNHSI